MLMDFVLGKRLKGIINTYLLCLTLEQKFLLECV
jgi:hypothetical protein